MSADDIFYGPVQESSEITLLRSEAWTIFQCLWSEQALRPTLLQMLDLIEGDMLEHRQMPLFSDRDRLRSVPASWAGWARVRDALDAREVYIASLQ